MQRYDRQTRLWSDSGQQNLAQAQVFAQGNSYALLECLKNLALAGVNRLVLNVPNDAHYLSSLALDRYLIELNPHVSVKFSKECPSTVDLVVLDRQESLNADSTAPCLRIESEALNGSVELLLKHPLPVIYSHPPPLATDLHLTHVWPELHEFCFSFDLDSLDEASFRHVPFPALLLQALKNTENAETETLKLGLRKLQRYGDEENFREASDNAYRLSAPAVPEGVQALVDFENQHGIGGGPMFGAFLRALSVFIARHGCLPVAGELNDMISTSQSYAQLRKLYTDKACLDVLELQKLAGNLPTDYIRQCAQNCRHMKLLVPNTADLPADKPAKIRKLDKETRKIELPPVAALIGGMASQEATKILSKHYVPINGRVMFHGATQTTELITTISIIN